MLLFYSSFIFITNIIAAIYFQYYLYACFFTMLTITSICYHTYSNIYTNIIDKVSILSIVVYGSNLLYSKRNNNQNILILIIGMFFLSIFLFYYGYITNQFCYNPNPWIGKKYHCLLHIISCVGHHMIIFM